MKNNETENIALFAPIQLDSFEQAEADQVRSKYPKAVEAIHSFKDAYASHVDKYRSLCEVLRAQNLGPRELTVLFLSEGISKVRASEFKRVVELPPEKYEQFQKGLISFRAALVAGRIANRAGDVESNTGLVNPILSAFQAFVNALDTSAITRKKMVGKVERLDCVFQLTVKRIRVAKKKAAKKQRKGSKSGGKRKTAVKRGQSLPMPGVAL